MSKEYIEREKVIEVIKNYGKNAIDIGQSSLDPVDDILLLQGAVNMIPAADVIVPPCKVGDTVWHKEEGYLLDSYKIKFIYYDMTASNISRDLLFSVEDFGKTVFLTKEEAEQALKEQNNEN